MKQHVEVVLAELSNEKPLFDPVGMTVSKPADDGTQEDVVLGRIVDLVQNEEDDMMMCSVKYDDGSEELFPFAEARERTGHEFDDGIVRLPVC